MSLFPDLKGPVTDCLNTPIPAISEKGFPITILFRKYVSPLEIVNQLLGSKGKQE